MNMSKFSVVYMYLFCTVQVGPGDWTNIRVDGAIRRQGPQEGTVFPLQLLNNISIALCSNYWSRPIVLWVVLNATFCYGQYF